MPYRARRSVRPPVLPFGCSIMNGVLVSITLFALVPVALAILGAGVAAVRPPGSAARSFIQHFAAGVVFSVVAVELLPDVVKQHKPVQVVVGFALGTLCMLGLRELARRLDGAEDADAMRSTAGLLAGVGVDLTVDGLLVGVGFAAGAKEGKLLVLALSVELLSLGLAVTASLTKSGAARLRAVATTAALSLLVPLGAVLSATVLGAVSESIMEVVLSFGLAALLYLVTEELLVEAHEEPETPLSTATFFAGFLLFLVLGMA